MLQTSEKPKYSRRNESLLRFKNANYICAIIVPRLETMQKPGWALTSVVFRLQSSN
jgi:uncharacterized protein YfdQ (DUF2303 family)